MIGKGKCEIGRLTDNDTCARECEISRLYDGSDSSPHGDVSSKIFGRNHDDWQDPRKVGIGRREEI